MAEKESQVASLTNTLDECSMQGDVERAEIAALRMQVETLQAQLAQASQEAKAAEERHDVAIRTLSEKESELARLATALDERSVQDESQKVENAALRTQVQTLNERLIQASKETRAVEESRDVERSELKAVTQNLTEERSKFENFHRRVVELVRQLTVQRTEVQEQRAREDLEDRLAEQSRLLNESEFELTHLRDEIEIARKAEDDLRIAIIEIDGRANATIQNLIAEKAQLQATLDRANGERVRLVHELKRRQAYESRAAEGADNAPLRVGVNDVTTERAAATE